MSLAASWFLTVTRAVWNHPSNMFLFMCCDQNRVIRGLVMNRESRARRDRVTAGCQGCCFSGLSYPLVYVVGEGSGVGVRVSSLHASLCGCGQALRRLVLHHPSVVSSETGRHFCILLFQSGD